MTSGAPGVVPLCAQVAYLASSLFLDSSSDLIILVVNTLQRDLKSDNHIVGMPKVSDIQHCTSSHRAVGQERCCILCDCLLLPQIKLLLTRA